MAGVRADEEHHVGDVLRLDQGLHRSDAGVMLVHLIEADALGIGLGCDHAVDAVTFDGAGADGIDADLRGSEFNGEAFGETDDGPFGRGRRGNEGQSRNDRRPRKD